VRLELWAEKLGILSGTQFGLRKDKETTDCLAVLPIEVKTAFILNNHVLAAFLDITGTYDNVLIDILCRELNKEGIPILLVFFLWDMMWEKHLYFFDGQDVAFICARAIRVYPKGSVLSPFIYNLNKRLVEACLQRLCSIFAICG
jgi:hypothetical protein